MKELDYVAALTQIWMVVVGAACGVVIENAASGVAEPESDWEAVVFCRGAVPAVKPRRQRFHESALRMYCNCTPYGELCTECSGRRIALPRVS